MLSRTPELFEQSSADFTSRSISLLACGASCGKTRLAGVGTPDLMTFANHNHTPSLCGQQVVLSTLLPVFLSPVAEPYIRPRVKAEPYIRPRVKKVNPTGTGAKQCTSEQLFSSSQAPFHLPRVATRWAIRQLAVRPSVPASRPSRTATLPLVRLSVRQATSPIARPIRTNAADLTPRASTAYCDPLRPRADEGFFMPEPHQKGPPCLTRS